MPSLIGSRIHRLEDEPLLRGRARRPGNGLEMSNRPTIRPGPLVKVYVCRFPPAGERRRQHFAVIDRIAGRDSRFLEPARIAGEQGESLDDAGRDRAAVEPGPGVPCSPLSSISVTRRR